MPGNSQCGRAVVNAMTHDFVLHPDQFIGLSIKSSYTEFQAYFHNSGKMHNCPRPCLEMEQACVPWTPNFPGINSVHDIRYQMAQHPNWWPELSSKSSDKDIVKALYTRGTKGVPRVCEDDEAPGHHIDYDEAASEQTESDIKAVQELLDRQKSHGTEVLDGSNEGGAGDDGWAADGDSSAEDGAWSDWSEDEASPAEEVSSGEGPEESKEASEEETPVETKETSAEESAEDAEEAKEASSEQKPKETEDGESFEHGAGDQGLQWPSHQEHHVYSESSESQSSSESHGFDGSDDFDGSDAENLDGDDAQDYGSEEASEMPCFQRGRSFSMLDVPEHVPLTVPDRDACQAQCSQSSAAHFLFYEPTKLCHCPPEGAVPMEVGSEFVSGDVNCFDGVVGKSDAKVPRLNSIGLNVTPGLMALIGCSMLAAVVPASGFIRKVTRARRLRLEATGFSRLDPLVADTADIEEARV